MLEVIALPSDPLRDIWMNQFIWLGFTVLATLLPSESKEHLLSVGITCFELDVTNDESVCALRKAVEKIGDQLEILVNNA